MIRFLPCPNCRRHVNSADAVCPFCEASMESAQPRAALALSLPAGRLGRIAVLAAGASLVGAAASCADSPSKTDAGAGGQGGAAAAAGGANGGGAGNPGTGGTSPTDAGPDYDGQIAIYAAAIALPKNKT